MQQTVVGVSGVTPPVGCGAACTEQAPGVTEKCAATLPGTGLSPEYAWHEAPSA